MMVRTRRGGFISRCRGIREDKFSLCPGVNPEIIKAGLN
jgi:hypothetical protein